MAAERRVRAVIDGASAQLSAAGVASPVVDAEELAALVLGVSRMRLILTPTMSESQFERFTELVNQRAQRIPLQHIVGSAAFGPLLLDVGPGVFTPRPETEWLLEWVVRVAPPNATVLDLCAGSGALALAIAHVRPDLTVHAVEVDDDAIAWTRRNADTRARAGDRPITLHHGDVTDSALLPELDGRVDVVVSNPPYIPDAAILEPEVADHDPAQALFGGQDGTDVIAAMVPNVARWLVDRGVVAIEHDDTNGDRCVRLLESDGRFSGVSARLDLTGRPRFVVAERRRERGGSA
ncbi:MAG: peptide chain release factor N(5)-glutamine methyltransferase [Nocardiaceae bacterium]|nr:peptide chain release factor N(5)-glutamine methyltransferase [Nocardiaceae bacterium]